jgi:hypothetical protein
MLDRFAEARDEAAHAREHLGDALPYTTHRVVYFEILFALLAGKPPDKSLLSMAAELAQPEAYMEWDLNKMLDHLRPRLSPEDYALLTALSHVINDRKTMSELEAQPAWRRAVLETK